MLHRPLCKAQSLAQCFGHKNQPYRFRMSNHCVQHYLLHRYLPFTQIPCNNENREVNTFSKCCKRFGFPTCHRFVRLTRNLFPQGYSLSAKNRRERGCVSPPLPASLHSPAGVFFSYYHSCQPSSGKSSTIKVDHHKTQISTPGENCFGG